MSLMGRSNQTDRCSRRRPRQAGLAIGLLVVAGCRSEGERRDRGAIDRLTQGVMRVQEAPNNAKAAPLLQLREEECAGPRSCEFKTLCVAAYSLHERSLNEIALVRSKLEAGDEKLDQAPLLALLGQAQVSLKEARDKIAQCLDQQAKLAAVR